MALDLRTRKQDSDCADGFQRHGGACTCRGRSPAALVDDGHTGGVGDGLVILGPNELGALGHLRALEDH